MNKEGANSGCTPITLPRTINRTKVHPCWCPSWTLAVAKALLSVDSYHCLFKRFIVHGGLQNNRQRRGRLTHEGLYVTQNNHFTVQAGAHARRSKEKEKKQYAVLLLFILRHYSHINRNGGKDGGYHCTNHCFANKMVMDALVQVGGGDGLCLVTKATLAVVGRRSCSNSTINPWWRGDMSELPIRYIPRLGKDEDKEEKEKDISSFSSSSATGAEVKAATVVAELIDDED